MLPDAGEKSILFLSYSIPTIGAWANKKQTPEERNEIQLGRAKVDGFCVIASFFRFHFNLREVPHFCAAKGGIDDVPIPTDASSVIG
jgi:hypothetical protein